MSADAHKWEVKIVQERNAHLSLSFEQAEKIWLYEEDKFRAQSSAMSVWEEIDYELHVYNTILDAKQLLVYERDRSGIIEFNIESFTEQDAWGDIGIKNCQDTLKFYEDFVPAFFNDPYAFSLGWLLSEDTKIKMDFLCAEYQRFLFNQKKLIISDHFRHYRTYKPKTLDASLLGHKLNCIWPDGYGFIQKMDEPTKAVFEFLRQKTSHFMSEKEAFIKDRLLERRVFQEDTFKKYYSGGSVGSIWERSFTGEEQFDQSVMLILLLKFNGYEY